jgi:hypothetical protein
MSLNLHPECKARLIKVIASQLPNMVIKNRIFLDQKSVMGLIDAESILPQTGGVKEALNNYISESPVFDFVYDSLSKELYELQKYSLDSPELMLTDVERYKDSAATASKLIDAFDSLPWKYGMTIQFEEDLSATLGRLIGNYSISDAFRIVTPDVTFSNKFPLPSGTKIKNRSLGGRPSLYDYAIPIPQEWKGGAAYVQLETDGFVGQFGDTATVERVISEVKAFCGLATALRLFKLSYKYNPTKENSEILVHQKVGDSWIIQRTLELDANISSTFSELVLDDHDGRLNSDAKLSAWALSILGSIKAVFSNRKKAERIILASQWVYDSYVGSNELLSFVLATVAIEILLGEKKVSDHIGLGELLRNRCAYLIGKSQQQRERILSEFQEIYDIRSKIVHRGKSRLGDHERMLLHKLQWMCGRVIREEINLLEKDLIGP